ncbi:MAG: hypothetical protein ACRCXX_11695 [Cetobacterium sp.]|uniref:hypothetical protein n=1 Tax=Cetobacterium sp. TaxID=2071632 RepID=UPI003F2A6FAC
MGRKKINLTEEEKRANNTARCKAYREKNREAYREYRKDLYMRNKIKSIVGELSHEEK